VIPSTVTQLLVTLMFVVPGFVYQSVRISIRGRLLQDVELSTRTVRAIVSSVMFGLIYLLALGDVLVDAARGVGYLLDHPRAAAALALGGGIIIPALVAGVAGLLDLPQWGWLERLQDALSEIRRYDPTPTAWDKAFQDGSEAFVRILNKEGRWIAGYYGDRSYASSYPEPPQIYLERTYSTSDEGEIGEEIPWTRGCIVDCADVQLLEMLAVPQLENADRAPEDNVE
jgi:hypothetical protein